jgi:hypothetical protein
LQQENAPVMTRKFLLFFTALITVFSLDSCTHYYYVHNQHNVPLFKEKNEVRASGAVIQSDEIVGADIQAAYAVTKEAAIMANALIVNPGSKDGKGQMYEVGAGYFKPLPSRYSILNNKFVFETYGVVGLGNSVNYYDRYPSSISTNLFKGYIQPTIGYTCNFFDLIVSAKIGALHAFGAKRNMADTAFSDLNQNGSTIGNDLNILSRNSTSFLFEPAFTIRLGYEYVKAHFQVGTSVMTGDLRQLTPVYRPAIDVGLTVFIARRFWQKYDRTKKDRWKRLFD